MSDENKFSSTVSSTRAIQQRQAADGTWQEWNYVTPPDDHSIYALVGRVAAAWAQLEYSLDRIIWTLADLNSPRGACLTAQMMGATPRYNAIIAQLTLRQHKEPEFAKHISRIKGLMNRTYEPQEKRNRIIHDPWLVDTTRDEPAQFRAWPRKNLQFGIRDVDLTEILDTIKVTNHLVAETEALYLAINADVGASLRRRRQQPSSSHPDTGE